MAHPIHSTAIIPRVNRAIAIATMAAAWTRRELYMSSCYVGREGVHGSVVQAAFAQYKIDCIIEPSPHKRAICRDASNLIYSLPST